MSKYVELPIDQIELDKSNPRIANFLATHDEKDITSDLMALLLGTTSDACASLRQSIEANYGIIHPIVVNKRPDGTYVVIEGNTRLQIYKDFRSENNAQTSSSSTFGWPSRMGSIFQGKISQLSCQC